MISSVPVNPWTLYVKKLGVVWVMYAPGHFSGVISFEHSLKEVYGSEGVSAHCLGLLTWLPRPWGGPAYLSSCLLLCCELSPRWSYLMVSKCTFPLLPCFRINIRFLLSCLPCPSSLVSKLLPFFTRISALALHRPLTGCSFPDSPVFWTKDQRNEAIRSESGPELIS